MISIIYQKILFGDRVPLKGESSSQACRSYMIVNVIVKDRQNFFFLQVPAAYPVNLYSLKLYNQSTSLHTTVLHLHTTILAELYDHTDFSVQLCVMY